MNGSSTRLCLGVLAACTALVCTLALGAAPASARVEHNPRGHFLGLVISTRSATLQASGGGNLSYHGGSVMHTNTTHVVYWLPANQTTYSFPAGYETTINQYLSDVAADGGKNTNVFASDAQYTDSGGRASYASTFAGALTDTDPYPASGCTDSGTTICLTDSQLQSELDAFINAKSLPRGLADLYFIVTPQGVGSCFTSSSSQCAYTYYCAYHSNFTLSSSTETLYANMPYVDVSGCTSGESPTGNSAADDVINVMSHEHNETATDPLGTAWYGSRGSEYNQTIHSDHYWLQMEWSNASSGCVQTMPAASPTASFTFSPTSPTTGQLVTFNGSGTSPYGIVTGYSWSFGDNHTGSGQSVQHAYANPGTYTATLTVTDNSGATKSSSQSVTVGGGVVSIGTVAMPDSGALPTGVVVDPANHVAYVAESRANAVAKITGTNATSFSGTATDVANATLCSTACALPGLNFPDDLALNTSGQVFGSNFCVGTRSGVCSSEPPATSTAVSQQTGTSSGQADTLSGCSYPSGDAVFTPSSGATRLFVSCAGSGVVAECSPAGGGTPACGSATPATIALAKPAGHTAQPVPSGMAAIPTTTTTPAVVVADAANDALSVVSFNGSSLLASAPVSLASGCAPANVAIGPSSAGTAAVYVACPGTGAIEVGTVSGSGTPTLGSFTATTLPTIGSSTPSPYGVAVNAAGTQLAISDSANNDAVLYPALSGTTLGTASVVAVGATPDGVSMDGSNAFVANEGSDTVSVIDPPAQPAHGRTIRGHASTRRGHSLTPLVAPLP